MGYDGWRHGWLRARGFQVCLDNSLRKMNRSRFLCSLRSSRARRFIYDLYAFSHDNIKHTSN